MMMPISVMTMDVSCFYLILLLETATVNDAPLHGGCLDGDGGDDDDDDVELRQTQQRQSTSTTGIPASAPVANEEDIGCENNSRFDNSNNRKFSPVGPGGDLTSVKM
mmetsp:Transcript_16247/g.39883  ORF Transcript_16247/g.39883 Transcript_16247/m.39883 type:complete len:107 (+) Transcript_16247:939-1259(+)